MKSITKLILYSSLLLLILCLSSCISDEQSQSDTTRLDVENKTQETSQVAASPQRSQLPKTLPVQYQTASYVVDRDEASSLEDSGEARLKVGARITTTKGPQPLWDILKRLAAMKHMSVSWGKDVDKNALVDVDVNPKDDYFDAINNLLAQLGYFAEFEKTTIFVRNKVTRQYRVAMPFLTQEYSTDIGGDIIGAGDSASGFKALISLKTTGSPVGTSSFDDDGARKAEFDIWANIEANLKIILNILESSAVETSAYEQEFGAQGSYSNRERARDSASSTIKGKSGNGEVSSSEDSRHERKKLKTSRQIAKDGSYFIIDKPVGIITITTTRQLHETVTTYLKTLKKALYQQISIEAKIIEVTLSEASSLGINWSDVLKNFGIRGNATLGDKGQVYPFIYNNDAVNGPVTYTDDTLSSYFKTINPGQFISNITMAAQPFDIFLNALNEQGDTRVLSNPKLSVMNGQPAFISVGTNYTYIDSIESDVNTDTNIVTYTVNTDRILSGIGLALTATILDDDLIVMHLVPITSDLERPIKYELIGAEGAKVGLPVVRIKEMSTTVRVRDGEMLIIGGLIDEVTSNKGEFAPLLGDIPFFKYLFGYEEKEHSKRELIILLKPRIL